MALAVSNQQSRDAALLRAMTELFALQNRHDPDALRRFEELATHYLGRVGVTDRAFVAERLSRCGDAPAAVLRLLARDLPEIASPILKRSPALGEFDLLTIVAATGAAHHRLIAEREDLTPLVVSALRLTGDAEVAAALAAYPSLVVSPAAPPESEQLPEAAAPPLGEPQPAEPPEAPAIAGAPDAAMPESMGEPVGLADAEPDAEPREEEADASTNEAAIAEGEPDANDDMLAETEATLAPAEPPEAPEAVEAGGAARFLDLDRDERLALLGALAGRRAALTAGSRSLDAEQAFRRALARARLAPLARQRQRDALVRALAQGLRLDEAEIAAMIDDPSGEALVILLSGIGLSEAEAQHVLLFANPVIAAGMESFERLSRLLAETSEAVASELIAGWRGETASQPAKPAAAGHQPLFADLPLRRGQHGAAEVTPPSPAGRAGEPAERRSAAPPVR